MQLTVEQIGDVAVVALHLEELDSTVADDLRQEMAPILKDHKKVVLNLQKIRFCDSSGCGAILSFIKHLGASGGELILCQVSKPVMTTFSLIRLHKLCKVVESQAEAVQAFSI